MWVFLYNSAKTIGASPRDTLTNLFKWNGEFSLVGSNQGEMKRKVGDECG